MSSTACGARIPVESRGVGIIQTCALPAGHDGPHTAEIPSAARVPRFLPWWLGGDADRVDGGAVIPKPDERPKRKMWIWVISTAWGVYSAPEYAVRVYSKRGKRRVFGWALQMVWDAHPAIILWPRGDSTYLPLFVIDKIERKLIEVYA